MHYCLYEHETETDGNTLPDSRFSNYGSANSWQSECLHHASAASYNKNPVSKRTEMEVELHTSEADVVE
jgi:hypothetical protein